MRSFDRQDVSYKREVECLLGFCPAELQEQNPRTFTETRDWWTHNVSGSQEDRSCKQEHSISPSLAKSRLTKRGAEESPLGYQQVHERVRGGAEGSQKPFLPPSLLPAPLPPFPSFLPLFLSAEDDLCSFFFFLQKFAGWILCAYCRMEQDLPPGGKRAAGAEALTNRQVSSKPPAPSLSLSSTPRARSTVAACISSPQAADIFSSQRIIKPPFRTLLSYGGRGKPFMVLKWRESKKRKCHN